MKPRAYSKGTLLWVDDHFALTDYLGDQGDADVWRRTFGDAESRVYRLLGLHLAIATSLEEAQEALTQLHGPENRDTFTIAVVDLRIPRNRGGEPDVKYGLKLARRLMGAKVPFFFLSSKSNALDELRKAGLESVPYYRKQSEQGRLMMPEELARAILNEFRNRISWIELEDILGDLQPDSVLPETRRDPDHPEHSENGLAKPARSHFPFFGSFRDFVERWEHRPLQRRNLTVVLRCPEDHSNAFVYQCLLVIFSHVIRAGRVSLKFIDVHSPSDLRTHAAPRAGTQELVAFRLNPGQVEPGVVEEVARARQNGSTVFVLPNDDSADPFLEILPRHQTTIYDDLPVSRFGDPLAREELIRRACEFVFQKWRLELDGEERFLDPFYLDHPEVAINPVNWVALMEQRDVARDLSDPYEILDVFYQTTSELGTPMVREKLATGLPLRFDELLRVAHERIDRFERTRPEWRKRALGLWLCTSWHSPYGVTDGVAQAPNANHAIEDLWEDHCLHVAVELSKRIEGSEDLKGNETQADLLRAKLFLEHHTVEKLLQGQWNPHETDGLEFLRWPHARYPMPAALSRRLREARRYLSVQSDYLDLAPLLPSGNSAWDVLRSLVDEYAARLEWMRTVADRLPEGWRQSVAYLTTLIDSRDVPGMWERERIRIWDCLIGLLRNALPISVLYHYLVAGKLAANQDRLHNELKGAKGYGILLGMIRGHRQYARTHTLRLRNVNGRAWGRAAATLRSQVGFGKRLAGELDGQGPERIASLLDLALSLLSGVHAGAQDLPQVQDGWLPEEVIGYPKCIQEALGNPLLELETDWFIKDKHTANNRPGLYEPISGHPASQLPSLVATRGECLWQGLDLLHNLRLATYPLRYFDGYPFLASLNDLRIGCKDSPLQGGTDVIEEVLQLLVWGLEGLVAQLRFCLEQAGHSQGASIALDTIELAKPPDFQPVPKEVLSRFFRVVDLPAEPDGTSRYGVFMHGIPGANISSDYTFHQEGRIIHLGEVAPAGFFGTARHED